MLISYPLNISYNYGLYSKSRFVAHMLSCNTAIIMFCMNFFFQSFLIIDHKFSMRNSEQYKWHTHTPQGVRHYQSFMKVSSDPIQRGIAILLLLLFFLIYKISGMPCRCRRPWLVCRAFSLFFLVCEPADFSKCCDLILLPGASVFSNLPWQHWVESFWQPHSKVCSLFVKEEKPWF